MMFFWSAECFISRDKLDVQEWFLLPFCEGRETAQMAVFPGKSEHFLEKSIPYGIWVSWGGAAILLVMR